ncbi:DUF2326 domain-containing protein [Bombella mellum]|uniref:DUF2326 domain-containing protein n=1 Tax=Bombella mellum TaxID=2039288 RepID=A0ABR5ZRR4_9PROT|nr:DUF2326 domain-containing protein [Bombella mellum]MBA5726938.1 hypothetical protein [Bombella mellum]
MIHGVYANKAGFHEFEVKEGVNLILAERTKVSRKKDTTNGIGKTLLLDIIDFCLGSDWKRKKNLNSAALEGWSFTLDITLAGGRLLVNRSMDDGKFVSVSGETEKLSCPLPVAQENASGIPVKDWCDFLGSAFFGLSNEDMEGKNHPSARALLGFFVRTGPDAYNDPFKPVPRQNACLSQVNNAFLLGLDWTKIRRLYEIKDEKKDLDVLKKHIRSIPINVDQMTPGALHAEYRKLVRQCDDMEDDLSKFEIMPEYREIEKKANTLTVEVSRLRDEIYSDKMKLMNYEASTTEPDEVDNGKLIRLFEEAKVILPHNVVSTLEQAKEFHINMIRDRKYFLKGEMDRLRRGVEKKDRKLEELVNERARYLSTLKEKRALDEFIVLQNEYSSLVQRRDNILQTMNCKKIFDERVNDVKLELDKAIKAIRQDYEERESLWSQALDMFADFSKALYEKPGSLIIDVDQEKKTGYRFQVKIEGGSSEGISKMQVFCYDLTLICFSRIVGRGIDFLIHDSTIFDGVDPRQRARALELVEKVSRRYDFQYICTMNIDSVPVNDLSQEFDYESLVRMTLSDRNDAGSLLGFRY